MGGRFVLATELVEGTSLAERLEIGPVSLPDAVRYVWQALEALECAHSQGVVHRDLTPAKLLLTADGELKLSGFNLARSTADPRLTQAGATIGTPHYMSPEQVQAKSDLDARSDLYSLGAVFYELISGRRPFEADNQFDVMLAHVEADPEPPSRYKPQVPPDLDSLILKALAKRPEDRFQTAAEFRDALMGISLGASPEPQEDLEQALAAMRRRGKENERQAQALAEEILADPSWPEAAAQKAPPVTPAARGRQYLALLLAAVLATMLFLLLNGSN
jgi:serine/threonine-protein kinase